MGLYRAVGRPLFFALPPEAAHRLAGALLGLPLPWRAIGGARDDPRLRLDLAGIPLANPIGLAAGFDKGCWHLGALGALGFGYVVGGTITRAPRTGNPKPRIVRYRARESMANSMGLPNPGAPAAAEALRRSRRTSPRFVSLADEAVDDVLANHAMLEPLVDAVELNPSCPNVSWGRDRGDEAHLAELIRGIARRGTRPLFVKLPPFRTVAERDAVLALARVAKDAGADGLTCSNTRRVADARLATGRGGLSGKDLFPATPRIVHEVREAIGAELPINACGGIVSAEDALACLEAGATSVQLYTGLLYEGPGIVGRLVNGLAEALASRGLTLSTLVGAA